MSWEDRSCGKLFLCYRLDSSRSFQSALPCFYQPRALFRRSRALFYQAGDISELGLLGPSKRTAGQTGIDWFDDLAVGELMNGWMKTMSLKHR